MSLLSTFPFFSSQQQRVFTIIKESHATKCSNFPCAVLARDKRCCWPERRRARDEMRGRQKRRWKRRKRNSIRFFRSVQTKVNNSARKKRREWKVCGGLLSDCAVPPFITSLRLLVMKLRIQISFHSIPAAAARQKWNLKIYCTAWDIVNF